MTAKSHASASPPRIRSVAIYTHEKPEKSLEERDFIRQVLRFLQQRNVKKIHADSVTQNLLYGVLPPIEEAQRYDLRLAIGGDGTLLKLIPDIQKKDGLILGINFGTLGFLSELQPENSLAALENLWEGEFRVDERLLLKIFVYRKDEPGQKQKILHRYALNEVTLGHGGIARLSNFNVKSGGRFLSTYRSDGLIFATPTGSTAYALSAGGAIVSPEIRTIQIVPVSPHRLTHRPIVLPAKAIMHVNFDTRADTVSLTIDGQHFQSLLATDEVTIQKATRSARFVSFKGSHFFRVLRNKLNWGERRQS